MSESAAELEKMIAKRDHEIVRLREEVQRLQRTLQEVQQSTANHISRLQQQLANKMENIERLKAKLHSQQDYEEIKGELRILKERRQASEHFSFLSSLSPATESAVLNPEGEVLSQRPQANDIADPNVAGVKIKRETDTPLKPNASTDLMEPSSTPDHASCGYTESSSRTTPSPHPHDPLLYLCMENDDVSVDGGSVRLNTCRNGENGNIYSSWSTGQNFLEGRVLEDVEKQIETAEIAQRVKELLHKHKIGQRVFGCYVLDRLQGSVSEILAHPKPWSKLTTRGKEPFLRMIHFLSDERNVVVLRMIQDRLRVSSPSSNILESSSPVPSPDIGCDDVIRTILEQAKMEFQAQNGGNETRILQGQSKYNPMNDDRSASRGSDDTIKGILEQARQEMQVQKDTKGQNRVDETSDHQVKQETDKQWNLDQDPPGHDLLNAISPSDFVQNIIKKVKSEIGADGTSSASCKILTLLPAMPSTNDSSTAHLSFSEANQKHSLSRKQDKGLSPHTKGEMPLVGMKIRPEDDHKVKLTHSSNFILESFKENCQPPQPQDAGSCSPYSELEMMLQFLELDTLSITRRVKEVLAENSLGQRLFGENVLGLTQGSVSDLLSRPKPWSELSKKGKEPFLRMYFWLKDPQNVQHLKAMKSTGYKACSKRPFSLLSPSQDALQDSTLTGLPSLDHSAWLNMAKRARVVLTFQEKEILNKAFQIEPYPSQHTTQRLALQLGLQPSTVTNWFYNHRSRLRRSIQDGSSVASNYRNSPLPEAEGVTQHHCSDPDSFNSPVSIDGIVTIKQEPSDAEVSEVRREKEDVYWDAEYVSTEVQSCRNLKLEEEETRRSLSPQPEDGDCHGKMVKEDPDGTGQDSRMFSANQKALQGDYIDLTTHSPCPEEPPVSTHHPTA